MNDVTALLGAPAGRVIEHMEPALETAPADHLRRLGLLLFDRTFFLLREAPRDQVQTENRSLQRFLCAPPAQQLRQRDPELFGSWAALGDLWTEAARRSDRAAASTILASQGGRGREVLEILAAEGGPLARGEVRQRTGLSESHLSHVLRDLEEGDLIERTREGREVVLDLGEVGREVVDREIRPPWVAVVADAIRAGLPEEPAALEERLLKNGAPSRLAAHQLAEAICRRGERPASAPGWVATERGLLRFPDRRPVHGFAAAAPAA
jgi:DNA-binding MarR family transcriptional regulator